MRDANLAIEDITGVVMVGGATRMPHIRLHALEGDLAGHHAIWANGNWRITFKFEGFDAELVDYQDYH